MQKNILKISFFTALLSLVLFLGFTTPAFAAGCPSNLSPVSGSFSAQYCTIGELITSGLKVLFAVVGLLAALFIVFGGFQYITSAGNDERAKAARGTITNAVIGLAVAILAYSIVAIVANTLSNNAATNAGNTVGNGINNVVNGVNNVAGGTGNGTNPPPTPTPGTTTDPQPVNGFPPNKLSACQANTTLNISPSQSTNTFGGTYTMFAQAAPAIDNNACGYTVTGSIVSTINNQVQTFTGTADGSQMSLNLSGTFFASTNNGADQQYIVQLQYREVGTNKVFAIGQAQLTVQYNSPSPANSPANPAGGATP